MTTLMLTDDEKARIRAEEIFRLEVSRELAASKPRRSPLERAWAFLNSSLGLWVLSSIVLAALTTAFAHYQSNREEQARKAELERRLDTEISSRISSSLAGLRLDKVRIEQGERYQPEWIYSTAQSYLDNFFITDPSSRRDFSVYPDYQNRTFRSLVFELRAAVDSPVRQELTTVLAAYEELLNLGSVESTPAQKTPGKDESLEAVKNAVELLDHRLTINRWRSQT